MKPTIISLSGSAESGKTTAVNILYDLLKVKKKRCLKISYGDYVKDIATKHYGWNGVKDEAGRTLLQTIGNKFRAKNPNFWVHTVVRLVDVMGTDFDYILIDDCRFPNEAYCWSNNDYKITTIKVNRPNHENKLTEAQRNDISETAMKDFVFYYSFDVYDIFQLRDRMRGVIDDL